ncbi:MAG: 16S rRNA (cytosine(1402)-N(4))-methyltransferase RsmH [Clostridia bacterium]|nr:16S rRNA (cytosine(1402)-N(4))-methyltransferase RsmH [Clostridia bacterium]
MDQKINFSHRSVLLDECIEALNIKPDGIYVDGTAGGGGHSLEIAKKLTAGGRLIAIDRDDAAIAAATERLKDYSDRVTFVRNNFSSIKESCLDLGIDKIDGVLLDLGVSSYQLDTVERGFTHNSDAPLDMRMDRRNDLDAYTVVNTYSADQLKKVIYNYGEERFAPKIAAAIVRYREKETIKTTGQLVDIIKSAIPPSAREGGHHPAKRTFQAIRIEVNGELDAIEPTIRNATDILAPEGRIAIITFHSLEDRIVKQTYADLASGCNCPRDLPVCVCGRKPRVNVLTRKPILPSERELEENPRSRSAKLRVAEKI